MPHLHFYALIQLSCAGLECRLSGQHPVAAVPCTMGHPRGMPGPGAAESPLLSPTSLAAANAPIPTDAGKTFCTWQLCKDAGICLLMVLSYLVSFLLMEACT